MSAGGVIVSVSGVRGVVGGGLTPDMACRFAAAYGSAVAGPVVLSRDSRPSGAMLRHAVLAGLLSTGHEVIDVGIAPTPTCGLAVRTLGAAGAVQITASHNPSPWNGLKLFGPDGAVLPAAAGEAIAARFDANDFAHRPWDGLGSLRDADALGWHRDRVLELVPRLPKPLRVLVDGNGGAGGPLALDLLRHFGIEPVAVGCTPDGHFAHEPEPTPAHLADVAKRVTASGAAIGLALDPDADRLALIDETGRCLSEELTLALAVQVRLAREPGPVVVNMSTSRVIEDLAKQAGVPFHRTAVGEANVVAGMRAHAASIGGEGNGGVIDPRVGWVRDPFIGLALILHRMAETGEPLSKLADALPQYSIVKSKLPLAKDDLPAAYERLRQRWPEAVADTTDGLRLDWPDRWLHLRGSNTEPIARLIAEAPTEAAARALIADAAAPARSPQP